MRADSAILQRLIHMTCWFTPLILRLGANQHLAHPGDIVFRHACAMGQEGIVSKRLGSRYRSGRSTDWLKSKNPAARAVRREAEEDSPSPPSCIGTQFYGCGRLTFSCATPTRCSTLMASKNERSLLGIRAASATAIGCAARQSTPSWRFAASRSSRLQIRRPCCVRPGAATRLSRASSTTLWNRFVRPRASPICSRAIATTTNGIATVTRHRARLPQRSRRRSTPPAMRHDRARRRRAAATGEL
jgi:hypothetical protein